MRKIDGGTECKISRNNPTPIQRSRFPLENLREAVSMSWDSAEEGRKGMASKELLMEVSRSRPLNKTFQ